MSTALEALNGHVVPDHEHVHEHEQLRAQHDFDARDQRLTETLAAEVNGLRELLDDELVARDHLTALLERSKERERRITRAIAVLEGTSAQGATSSSARPAAAAPKASAKKKNAWDVSEATVERVRDGFMRYWRDVSQGEPFTQTLLCTWMGENGEGVGGDTIRRVMAKLREREIVRVTGTTRGGGKLWAPMPEHAHVD